MRAGVRAGVRLCVAVAASSTIDALLLLVSHTPAPPKLPKNQSTNRHAFPYQPYAGAPALRTGLLADHFAHQTALRDFNEVMPVLVLPTSFTPGLARSVDRGAPGGGVLPPLSSSSVGGGNGADMVARTGHGSRGQGNSGAGRKFGTRQGVEAVGGNWAGQQGRPKEEGGNENGRPLTAAEGGGEAAPAPLLGKGEALTLDKLPWRL